MENSENKSKPNDKGDSSQDEEAGESNVEEVKENSVKQRRIRLPLARVRHIMKKDTDCGNVAADAVFLVTKATEMFIEYMAKETYKQIPTGKRKTILQRDVVNAVDTIPHLCFLDGCLE